jgi:hypothetical protein
MSATSNKTLENTANCVFEMKGARLAWFLRHMLCRTEMINRAVCLRLMARMSDTREEPHFPSHVGHETNASKYLLMEVFGSMKSIAAS